MSSLYEIVEEIRALDELIEFAYSDENVDLETGEYKDTDVIKQIEEEIELLLTKKGEGLIKYIKTLESNAEMCKQESDRLKKKEKAFNNKIDNIKKYIQVNMEKVGSKKIETPLGNLVMSESVSTVIDDKIIDKKYGVAQPITYKFDAKEIKKLLTNGEHIDGAMLVVKKNLNIK